jgi:putative acetyltransferase
VSLSLTLRRMRPGEEPRLYEVLRASVMKGTAGDYDEAERRAWAPARPAVSWPDRLQLLQTFVAADGQRPIGFIAVSRDGHLDLAYVTPELIGRGIGGQLLDRVETEMRLSDVGEMTCDASKGFRRLLERRGWEVVKEEVVRRGGVALARTRMRKRLD